MARLLDEEIRQANKSASTLQTQAFKLPNGTRYKATAADGELGGMDGNTPAAPASYMNPNLRPQNVAGNVVVPLPAGPSYTAYQNTRARLGTGQIVSMPANTTINFGNAVQPTFGQLLTGNYVENSVSGTTSVRGSNVGPKSTGGYRPSLVPIQNGFGGVQMGAGAVGAQNNVNLGLYNNSPYNGFQTPTTNGFMVGNAPSAAAPFQTPATNGFMAPTTTGGFLSGDKQGQVNSTTTKNATPNMGQPPRPTGWFDPNDQETAAQWRAYWNWEAQNPQAAAAIALSEGRLSSAPVVMSRQQIWEMKAAQRRRRGAESTNTYNPVQQPSSSDYALSGMYLNYSISAG